MRILNMDTNTNVARIIALLCVIAAARSAVGEEATPAGSVDRQISCVATVGCSNAGQDVRSNTMINVAVETGLVRPCQNTSREGSQPSCNIKSGDPALIVSPRGSSNLSVAVSDSTPSNSAAAQDSDEFVDSDADGMPDAWETLRLGSLAQGGDADPDRDGLSNLQEYRLGTLPTAADTDDDELKDGDEVRLGTNPVQPDSDMDGMPDGWEIAHGLNPHVDDSGEDADGDGLVNGLECVSE